MNNKKFIAKDQNQNQEEKEQKDRKLIGVDQPFDYEEVAKVTGSDYVQHLRRNGIAVLPYEELKKNVTGFKLLEDRCIWMKAGIINFRNCDYDNDCYNCPFDHAMRAAMGEKALPERMEKQESWVRRLQERYKVAAKPCVYFKSGCKESPEECTGNYECYGCSVHQMQYAERQVPAIKKPTYTKISGFHVADEYHHHFGHTWVHLEHNGCVRIGIDAFISKVLGPVDTINLPPVGAFLKQGEIGWIMTRNGLEAPVQSPLSGTVCAVNTSLKDRPETANRDPYETGWLILLDPADLKLNLKGLYYGEDCVRWIQKEHDNLLKIMEPSYEGLAATGGEWVDDIYLQLPETGRYRLVREFLHTTEK